jgi:hypothetical protein
MADDKTSGETVVFPADALKLIRKCGSVSINTFSIGKGIDCR